MRRQAKAATIDDRGAAEAQQFARDKRVAGGGVSFAGVPRERSIHQTMITLPASCRFNNSLGDDVEYDFWLAQGYPPRRV